MAKEHPDYNIIGAFEENEDSIIDDEQNGVVCNYKSYEELLADESVEVVALGGCYGDRGNWLLKHFLAESMSSPINHCASVLKNSKMSKGLLRRI